MREHLAERLGNVVTDLHNYRSLSIKDLINKLSPMSSEDLEKEISMMEKELKEIKDYVYGKKKYSILKEVLG